MSSMYLLSFALILMGLSTTAHAFVDADILADIQRRSAIEAHLKNLETFSVDDPSSIVEIFVANYRDVNFDPTCPSKILDTQTVKAALAVGRKINELAFNLTPIGYSVVASMKGEILVTVTCPVSKK